MPDAQRPAAHRTAEFRVGDWLAEPDLNRLTTGGTELRIRPQLMDVLVCLAGRAGKTVLKDELLAEVWPDRFISESGLVRCIAELRQLLGDDPHKPRYIETIAKRGYRLIAAVTWIEPQGEAATSLGRGGGAEPAAAIDGADRGSVGGPVPPVPMEAPAPAGREGADPRQPARPHAIRGWRGWAALAVALVLVAAAVTVAIVIGRRAGAAGLTDRDTVVLAFENTTGEQVFDETLPLALAINLEQSPFLQILPAERVSETLGLMKRAPETPVTRVIGMEVCERAGATALVVGSVTAIGQRYVLGLEAVACPGGASIARRQIQVSEKDAVLEGLGRAASELRRAVGESLASVQAYGVPITEATTSSLEALRALRQGDAARDRGQNSEALRLYREAVARDPDFALAHARVGGFALAQHYEGEGVAGLERAFALRDRVTFPERLEIELVYHAGLTGDQNKITETLETMRRVYPRRLSARRRLASHYLNIGRYDDALAEALDARMLEPSSSPAISVVARAQLTLNRWADVRATVEAAMAQGLDDETQHAQVLMAGLVTGDTALVARERAWGAAHPEAAPYFLEIEAEDAVWRGRLRDSLTYLDRYQAWAVERSAEHRRIVLELRKARFEALCGFGTRAMARVARELANPDLGFDLKVDALKVAVSARDVARMSRLLEEFDRAGWPRAEQPFAGFVLSYRAALETEHGRPERALELLEPMIPFELGYNWGLIPLHERARAHLAAGHWQEARNAFQKMLDHPGVGSGQKLLPLAQLGVARALSAGGQSAESRRAYEQFFELWKGADPDLPLLAEARREHARLK